jgi:hypothetical protein
MPKWDPQNLVFTGNSLCGSACADFTNFMVQYLNVTSYMSTVQPWKPIEMVGWATNYAYDTNDLYAEINSLNLTGLVEPLHVKGDMHFTLVTGLSPINGEFIQYRSLPAAKTYAPTFDTQRDPMVEWKYVAGQVWPGSFN